MRKAILVLSPGALRELFGDDKDLVVIGADASFGHLTLDLVGLGNKLEDNQAPLTENCRSLDDLRRWVGRMQGLKRV